MELGLFISPPPNCLSFAILSPKPLSSHRSLHSVSNLKSHFSASNLHSTPAFDLRSQLFLKF